MKYVFGLLFLTLVVSFRFPGDFYGLPLKTLEGQKVDLNAYRGKKLLFVLLPLSGQDSSLTAGQLEALHHEYDSTLVVVGIAAEESGYKKEQEGELRRLYKSTHPHFILAEGMKVKKSSGPGQAPLFQWLTQKERNHHFDQEVLGPGHKFFVDEAGELYAVLGPQIRLDHPVLERILSRAMPAGKP